MITLTDEIYLLMITKTDTIYLLIYDKWNFDMWSHKAADYKHVITLHESHAKVRILLYFENNYLP